MSESVSPPMTDEQATGGEYAVIARRYRPQSFDELVGQEHVARALQQAIAGDRVGHAYLFTGARGVGKTSAARILAKALNCVHGPTPTPCNECDVCMRVSAGDDVDVLEIDGASNNTVDEVRELRQNVAVRPSRTRYKVYIIDEVHMLSKSAFNALLKTLEEPPEHVKFIFATTEPHKIPITILSRCQRFDFAGISSAAIQARLAQIAASEGVKVDAEALQILASRAAGSMRDSQSLLEQLLAVGHEHITAGNVNELLGIASAERLSGLVQHLVARDAAAALAALDATLRDGVEVGLLLDQLMGYFRDVMTAAVGCPADQMLYALPSQAEEVAEIGRQIGLATILAIGQILDHTAARMRVSMQGRTLVEIAIVRICQLDELDDLAALTAELRGTAGDATERNLPRPAGAKKKVEPPSASSAGSERSRSAARSASIGSIPPPPASGGATASGGPPPFVADSNRVLQAGALDSPGESATVENGGGEAEASVLKQYQQALSNVAQAAEDTLPRPVRVSHRQRTAEIAERPFIRRAIELFDVPPGQLRYTPPDGDSN